MQPTTVKEIASANPGKPWLTVPIRDCGEPLLALPRGIPRVSPHPYASLGAPYPPGCDPYRLRWSVLLRLERARKALRRMHQHWDLTVFDAWRPIPVQSFMVEHACRTTLEQWLPDGQSATVAIHQEVRERVAQFWAQPSTDPRTPPPHSTGGAIDLTIAGEDGEPLEMGSAIDALGPESRPDYFGDAPEQATIHHARLSLRQAMLSAGFAPHPLEWWHFSYGDQHWAWQTGSVQARYGARDKG